MGNQLVRPIHPTLAEQCAIGFASLFKVPKVLGLTYGPDCPYTSESGQAFHAVQL